jgi:hypothetical protein
MTTNEKINSLTAGTKIIHNGKTYEVKSLYLQAKKINRWIVSILEVGKPETRMVNGIGLAKGQIFEISNIITITVSNYQTENNWQLA